MCRQIFKPCRYATCIEPLRCASRRLMRFGHHSIRARALAPRSPSCFLAPPLIAAIHESSMSGQIMPCCRTEKQLCRRAELELGRFRATASSKCSQGLLWLDPNQRKANAGLVSASLQGEPTARWLVRCQPAATESQRDRYAHDRRRTVEVCARRER